MYEAVEVQQTCINQDTHPIDFFQLVNPSGLQY